MNDWGVLIFFSFMSSSLKLEFFRGGRRREDEAERHGRFGSSAADGGTERDESETLEIQI